MQHVYAADFLQHGGVLVGVARYLVATIAGGRWGEECGGRVPNHRGAVGILIDYRMEFFGVFL